MGERYVEAQTEPTWQYHMVAEWNVQDDLGSYRTYGIELTEPGRKTALHDVSTYEEVTLWITELLNFHQVSSCHFIDIVEDLLSCQYDQVTVLPRTGALY